MKANEWFKKEFGSEKGSKEIMVSPEIAERWLNVNTHNRTLSEKRIKLYSRQMVEGKWLQSPDCLLFFNDGKSGNALLGNGQHRLWGLANAKEKYPSLKVPFFVRWGLDNKISNNLYIMDFIDRGRGRTSGENWGRRNNLGSTDTKRIAAASNILASIFVSSRRQLLEAYEMNYIYQIYKKEFDMVLKEDRNIKRLSVASIHSGLVFAAKINPEKTMEFENSLFTGENLSSGNPILTFRNRVLLSSFTLGRGRISIFKELLTSIKYFIEGQSLSKLYTNDRGYYYFLEGQKETLDKIIKYLNFKEEEE